MSDAPREYSAGGRAVRVLAATAAAATYALVVLGGIVRVTGSGMGCGDDWPLCHGSLIPPLDLPTLVEYGHRLAASLVGLLVVALAVAAWRGRGRPPGLRGPAAAAAALLVVQVLLGAVAVKLELPTAAVVLHLATAMLLLATLLACALTAAGPPPAPAGPLTRALARGAAAVAFAVVVLGGLVANLDAGAVCGGFPLCNGGLLPAGGAPVRLHAAHRLAAFALVGFLLGTFVVARHERRSAPAAAAWAGAAAILALVQVAVAAAMLASLLAPGWRVAHMALGTLIWAALAGLVVRTSRPSAARPATARAHEPARVGARLGGTRRRAAVE